MRAIIVNEEILNRIDKRGSVEDKKNRKIVFPGQGVRRRTGGKKTAEVGETGIQAVCGLFSDVARRGASEPPPA